MTSALSGAGGGGGIADRPPTPEGTAFGAAKVPERTAFHTSFWFCATAACSRTLGCTITLASPNCELAPVHRPCSTQKTSSGSGSDPTGTILSFPIIRSCFPPLTNSPASKSNGRLLRLISTSWFTLAPLLYCGTATGRPARDRAKPAAPCSLIITSPLESPSSNVKNGEVSCMEELTTGKIVIFS